MSCLHSRLSRSPQRLPNTGRLHHERINDAEPLLISTLLTHADRHHGSQQIVSRRVEGDVHRYTYRELGARARSMANALSARGFRFGDRVATLAWNGYRHMELYYAVSGSGAVLHSLNPRLHPDQVVRPRRVWRAKFNTRGRTRAQTARTSP